MSVKMMAATPASAKRRAKFDGGDVGRFGPAFDRDAPAARIDADHDAARKAPAGLAHQLRIAQRHGAEDDAADAVREPGLDLRQAADAAAELHRNGHGLEDRLDGRAIHRLAGEGAVEIDEMQPGEALALEAPAPARPDRR